jgi:tetratricopeptide (TPR) repeat protein
MSKQIAIAFLLIIFQFTSKAQEKLNYAGVDKQSYQLFLDGKWAELIQYASEARKQGIDFFYLQVRTGIAWYKQGKFRNAAPWFLKAFNSDKSFDWLQEYVYYSLVSGGRELEAARYTNSFTDAVKAKIGYRNLGLRHLAYEYGYSFNPDFKYLKVYDFSTEINLGADYGEGYFLKNYNFHSVDLSHRINSNLILNHNLTYFGVNKEAVVSWVGQTNSPIKINQLNYYISPVFVLGEKLKISPSLNLLFGKGEVYAGKIGANSEKKFTTSMISYNDFVISTVAWNDFGNFSPGIEINACQINETKFVQASSWLIWNPLSNPSLYFTPKIYFKTSEQNDIGWNAMSVSGGAKLGKFYLTGQYLFGDMENFVESAGYVVSNFTGISDWKLMGSIYFPVGKKHQFVLRYINQQITEKYQAYTGGFKSKSLDYNYLKQTITAGMSWNF